MRIVALRHDAAAPVDRRRRRAGCVADRDRGLLQQLKLQRTLQDVERIAGEEETWLEGFDAEPGCGRCVAHDTRILTGTANRCKPSHEAPSETHEGASLVLGGEAVNRQKMTSWRPSDRRQYDEPLVAVPIRHPLARSPRRR